jgi:hypothetical protein
VGILRILEFHWNAIFSSHSNWHISLPLFLTWLVIISLTDFLVGFVLATARGITLNELNKPYAYKCNLGVTDPSKAQMGG